MIWYKVKSPVTKGKKANIAPLSPSQTWVPFNFCATGSVTVYGRCSASVRHDYSPRRTSLLDRNQYSGCSGTLSQKSHLAERQMFHNCERDEVMSIVLQATLCTGILPSDQNITICIT